MTRTDDVTTKSPSILMIEGCEHVLYQGLTARFRIADARLLWLNTARGWLIALYALLSAINAARSHFSLWLSFVGLAAIGGAVALSVFTENRGVLTTPLAVVERERAGGSSTLAITAKSPRSFSGQPTVTQFATVHPEMADFLLAAFAEGQSRRFRQRPRVPVALSTRRARVQSWAEIVGLLVAIVALVLIVVAMVNR